MCESIKRINDLTNTNMKKIATFLSFVALSAAMSMMFAQTVVVKLKPDDSFRNGAIVRTMEYNLSLVLTEINNAQRDNRQLNMMTLPMNEFSKKTLAMLWKNIHFYCDDEFVVERLWNFNDGYMARQIPLIITPQGEEFGSGTFQEAVVEFDKSGTIRDFRFALDATVGESMEKCGEGVTEIERRMQILAYCDRFRTAYNTKDIKFLEQVFSEDALIITGTVVTPKKSDFPQPKIRYKKQNKTQYLNNLRAAFKKNKWIDVRFFKIGDQGVDDGCMVVTRSTENPNIYGVRLRQEWHSSSYSDEGYVFLLWDFTDEVHPVIHVRTWQPEYVGTDKISEDEIFSLSDFLK